MDSRLALIVIGISWLCSVSQSAPVAQQATAAPQPGSAPAVAQPAVANSNADSADAGPSLHGAREQFTSGIKQIGGSAAQVVGAGAQAVANVVAPVVRPIVAVGEAFGEAAGGVGAALGEGALKIKEAFKGNAPA
ncbi:hypothetical protein RvY_14553 [Ramazzottius varieornatus]|uniref:Uncharacterized protein n=1 Tax=Ramazzottius varieornatus TaxID=947166 RepID=A0A1D1VVI4_RAMVA|nr:hypothetical protein RvY_14553 [Ramazzottius varieornatus]